MGDRAIKTGNKQVYYRELHHKQSMHYERLRTIKPTVKTNAKCFMDNTAPPRLTHLVSNLKGQMLDQERCDIIDRENSILLGKLSKLMSNPQYLQSKEYMSGLRITNTMSPTMDCYKELDPTKSLNREARRRELTKIASDNNAMYKRLVQRPSCYSKQQWANDRSMAEKYMDNIRAFPPPSPPKPPRAFLEHSPTKLNNYVYPKPSSRPGSTTKHRYGTPQRGVHSDHRPRTVGGTNMSSSEEWASGPGWAFAGLFSNSVDAPVDRQWPHDRPVRRHLNSAPAGLSAKIAPTPPSKPKHRSSGGSSKRSPPTSRPKGSSTHSPGRVPAHDQAQQEAEEDVYDDDGFEDDDNAPAPTTVTVTHIPSGNFLEEAFSDAEEEEAYDEDPFEEEDERATDATAAAAALARPLTAPTSDLGHRVDTSSFAVDPSSTIHLSSSSSSNASSLMSSPRAPAPPPREPVVEARRPISSQSSLDSLSPQPTPKKGLSRQQEVRQDAAAIRIQSQVRRKQASTRVKLLKEQKQTSSQDLAEQQQRAAVTIQCLARRRQAVKLYRLKQEELVRLQDEAAQARHSEESASKSGGPNDRLSERERAAIKIQAQQRRRLAEKRVAAKQSELMAVKAVVNASDEALNDAQNKEVGVVGEAQRTVGVSDTIGTTDEEKEAAVLKIQCLQRQRQAKRVIRQKKAQLAALEAELESEQDGIKGLASDTSLDEQEKAAIRIQAQVRRKAAKRAVLRKRESLDRAKRMATEFDALAESATVQLAQASTAADRLVVDRIDEHESTAEEQQAATRIQSHVRRRQAKARVASKREEIAHKHNDSGAHEDHTQQEQAATRIQSHVRRRQAKARVAAKREDLKNTESAPKSEERATIGLDADQAALRIQCLTRRRQARLRVSQRRQELAHLTAELEETQKQEDAVEVDLSLNEQQRYATRIQAQVRRRQASARVEAKRREYQAALDEAAAATVKEPSVIAAEGAEVSLVVGEEASVGGEGTRVSGEEASVGGKRASVGSEEALVGLNEEAAALRIQTLARKKLATNKLREKQAEMAALKAEIDGVDQVLEVVGESKLSEEERAAVKIQAHVRRREATKRVSALRDELRRAQEEVVSAKAAAAQYESAAAAAAAASVADSAAWDAYGKEQEEAAIKIQSLSRQRTASRKVEERRRIVAQKKAELLELEAQMEAQADVPYFPELNEREQAAIKIQAQARRRQAQLRVDRKKEELRQAIEEEHTAVDAEAARQQEKLSINIPNGANSRGSRTSSLGRSPSSTSRSPAPTPGSRSPVPPSRSPSMSAAPSRGSRTPVSPLPSPLPRSSRAAPTVANEQEAAAIKIQAHARRRQAQKRVANQRDAQQKPPPNNPSLAAPSQEAAAALKIQSHARRRQATKRVATLKETKLASQGPPKTEEELRMEAYLSMSSA